MKQLKVLFSYFIYYFNYFNNIIYFFIIINYLIFHLGIYVWGMEDWLKIPFILNVKNI